MTPYDVLDKCKAILQERGKQRDASGDILESSFKPAAEIYCKLFAAYDMGMTPRDIMEVMIALKLARISTENFSPVKDGDSVLDLINYLAFWYAECHNNYEASS